MESCRPAGPGLFFQDVKSDREACLVLVDTTNVSNDGTLSARGITAGPGSLLCLGRMSERTLQRVSTNHRFFAASRAAGRFLDSEGTSQVVERFRAASTTTISQE